MNIWEILGIEYTDDINIIKKAYAKKLKVYHPEEDADGYQRLREAYDQAVKNAKFAKLIGESQVGFENDNETDCSTKTDIEDLQSVTIPHRLNSTENYDANSEFIELINLQDTTNINSFIFESRLEKFLEQLDSIYIDFSLRINLSAWVEILNHDIMWEMDRKQEMFSSLVDFFSSHRFLPKEIWVLLDDALQLRDQLEEPIFSEFNSLRDFLVRAFNQRSMTFEFLFNIEYQAREKFIEFRIHALDCLQRKDYALVFAYIDDAKGIFDGDPELTCIDGLYLSVSNRIAEAIEAFSNVLEVMPHSEEALLGRANIYLCNDHLNSAMTDFEALTVLRPYDNELAVRLAKIYLKVNDPISARALFKKINAYEPNQNESFVEELVETNKALIKMSKTSCDKGREYFEKELPHIKVELRKLQNYKRLQNKSKSDGIYKGYFKFIFGVVLVLLILFIANIFYKSNFNHDTLKKANGINQEQNGLNNGNDITNSDSDEKASTVVNDFSKLDLDRLSKTGEKISITLSDPQILSYCIYNSSEDNAERLLPIPKNVIINKENEKLLKFNNKLYIGRIGNKSLFFRGSIYNLINVKSYRQPVESTLPSEVNVEGRIIKNDIAEFKSQVMNDISNIEWYGTNLDSVNTDYLLKMDDYYNLEELTHSSGSFNGSILIIALLVFIGRFTFRRYKR